MRFHQRLGELVGVKIRANGLDGLAGMKIEVDLTEA
jgi:hypothetical protein